MKQLKTRWTDQIDVQSIYPTHPCKKLERKQWENLNGYYDFTITQSKEMPDRYDSQILVPYPVESYLSHIKHITLPNEYLWYHRLIDIKEDHHLVLLHFEAVDQICEVYLNHSLVTTHIGGYLPFVVDVTNYIQNGQIDLTLCVMDLTDTSYHAIGKQSLEPKGMYYTSCSGIWKSVWLEYVNEYYIQDLEIETHFDESYVSIHPKTNKICDCKYMIHFDHLEYPDSSSLLIQLPKFQEWNLETPYLYEITIEMYIEEQLVDTIHSYFAMRKIEKRKDDYMHIYLNNQKIFIKGVLDQGYYPDGIMTAPCEEAYDYDILKMKELGFNTLRKHIKIEPDYFYYACDKYGMLVMQDFVNGGSKVKSWYVSYLGTALNYLHIHPSDNHPYLLSRKSQKGKKEWLNEMSETVQLLKYHPSIIAYTIFNEGWGQFDTRRITSLLRQLDSTRLIDAASGWFDQKCGDFNSIHHYFLNFKLHAQEHRLNFISEFGGFSLWLEDHSSHDHIYGYKKFNNKEDLSKAYEEMMNQMIFKYKDQLCGFIYTQLSDIEEEVNGILTYDREIVKIDEEVVKRINLSL